MRSVVITKHGSPEVLKIQEAPDPVPGKGQVRLRVQAAGVNFADIAARVGLYPDAPNPPCVVGYEVGGVVDAVGAEVTGWREGDRAFAITRFGGYASAVCVPAASVFPLSPGMTAEEGAAFPVGFLTAHHLLHWAGQLRPRERLLIHQAAGGVGTCVVQLAKLLDAEIFGTASVGKHARLRELGVAHPIDYHTVDPAEEIVRIAGERSIHLALDPIGNASWRRSYQLLAPGGRLLMFGFSSMVPGEQRNLVRAVWDLATTPRFTPLDLMTDNRTVGGVNMGALWDHPGVIRPQMDVLQALWQAGTIRPLLDRSFPAEEAPEAHRYVQQGKNFGKVVLTF